MSELPVGHCNRDTAVNNAKQASGGGLLNPASSVNTRAETNKSGIFSGFLSGSFLAVPTESAEEFTQDVGHALTASPTIMHKKTGAPRATR